MKALRKRYAATRARGPSPEQLGVLHRLASDPDHRLVRVEGGFWTTSALASTWDPKRIAPGGAPWHTGTRTVRAMEGRGWLARIGRFSEEWRDDRTLTEPGSTLARVPRRAS